MGAVVAGMLIAKYLKTMTILLCAVSEFKSTSSSGMPHKTRLNSRDLLNRSLGEYRCLGPNSGVL